MQSKPQWISCGVPQGSILRPLLFLIYLNDVSQMGLKGISINLRYLYADDTNLFYSGHNIGYIVKQAQHDLDFLNNRLQTNLLTINTSKTNYMIFAAKNKKNWGALCIN